jgi:rare lipoprotein A
MPRRPPFNSGAGAGWLTALAVLVLAFASCERRDEIVSGSALDEKSATEKTADGLQLKVKERHKVYAAWYDVPADSLVRKRAGSGELTAAHNKLPLGTLVRVTHLGNGKNVLVRITDRGITKRKVKVDLCKEAAEELDMIGEGIARVQMEVLQEEQGSMGASSPAVAAPQD